MAAKECILLFLLCDLTVRMFRKTCSCLGPLPTPPLQGESRCLRSILRFLSLCRKEEFVNAPDLGSALGASLYDRRSEAPDTINALKRSALSLKTGMPPCLKGVERAVWASHYSEGFWFSC